MSEIKLEGEENIDLFWDEVDKDEPCVVYTYLDEENKIAKVLYKDTAAACMEYIYGEIAKAEEGDERVLMLGTLEDFADAAEHLH